MRTRLSPDFRRQQILDGARRARDTKGLFHFTCEDVAEVCGIRPRLVRHYFTMMELRQAVQPTSETHNAS